VPAPADHAVEFAAQSSQVGDLPVNVCKMIARDDIDMHAAEDCVF
jgi:hypothetical protein